SLVAVKIARGILYATSKNRRTKTYLIRYDSPATNTPELEQVRTLWIEHPRHPGWKLVSPARPTECTREFYRFEAEVLPGRPRLLEAVEEQPRGNQVMLASCAEDAIRLYLRAPQCSAKVKLTLENLLRDKAKLAETQRAVAKEESALQLILQDQERLRANLGRVPPTSQAYKRYLKKFDDQETEIEKRRGTIAELEDMLERKRKQFEESVLKLDVE